MKQHQLKSRGYEQKRPESKHAGKNQEAPTWALEAFPATRETEPDLPPETVALILHAILQEDGEAEILANIGIQTNEDPQLRKEIQNCIGRTCKWLGLPENFGRLGPEARYKAIHRWAGINSLPRNGDEYHNWEPLEADYTGLIP